MSEKKLNVLQLLERNRDFL